MSTPISDDYAKSIRPIEDTNISVLRRALQEVEKLAGVLRRQIHACEDGIKRHASIEVNRDAMRQAGHEAHKIERGGVAPELAAERVARTLKMRPDTVAFYQAEARKAATTQARAIRDREIVRLASRGYTNAEIAKRFGITPRTVTRVIAAAFRPS